MWNLSVFSPVLCFLLFFFLLLLATSSKNLPTITKYSTDIINETCNRCASYSPVLSYNFCISSLQAVPVGHITNLQGLALVSMELAMENATNTISSIEKMLSNESLTPYEFACLADCLELYSDGVETLIESDVELSMGDYNSANVKVSAVMEWKLRLPVKMGSRRWAEYLH